MEGRRGTPTSASSNLLGPVPAPTLAVLGDPRAVGSEDTFSDSPNLFPPAFLRPQRSRANWGSGRKSVAFARDAPPTSGFLICEVRLGWGAAPQLPGLYAVSPPGSGPRAVRVQDWGHPRRWGLSRGDVRPETGPGLSPKSVFPRRVLTYWGHRAHSMRGHSADGCPRSA